MSFTTGLSALRANQIAMSVVGNNIANAATEGFRRQEVLFEENPHIQYGGYSVGTGVSIADIRSASAVALENAVVDSASQGAALTTMLTASRRLESLFMPGTGNVQERTEEFFSSLIRLSANPTEATLRSSVVNAASDLAKEINNLTAEIDKMLGEGDREIETVIASINSKSASISELNAQIQVSENLGEDASNLRLQRDSLVKELATLIDVEQYKTPDGDEHILIGGGLFSVDSGLEDMLLIRTENGELEVWKEGCDSPHKIRGGRLASLIAQSDPTADGGGAQYLKSQLEEFTTALVQHLDGAHATGVGILRPITSINSARPIDVPSANLASQETISPIDTGSLFVSVNQPHGTVSLEEVNVVAGSESLNDIATSISAINGLAANVDSTGRISIVAESGYTFDFTGNLQSHPALDNISGTSVPSISGRVQGDQNDEWTFRFLGSGTVGVTEGLQVEVVDSNNLTRRILSVGTNYEPLSKLVVGDGVELSLSSGTVVAGDSFTTQVVGRPDETGILAALGLNTLFVGNDAHSLAINPEVAANSALLATTTNGDPSDTRNLLRMIAVRDAAVLKEDSVSLEQFLSDMIGGVGNEAAELARDVAGQEEHEAFLKAELDAAVGVDVNEELARMLTYQRGYQAAARYISTIDLMLQELFGIIG